MNKKTETIHIAGIDLPKQLYDAAKNDALVIFAGAGISMPSEIPNFVGLTEQILEGAPKEYDPKLSCSEKLEIAEQDGIDIRRETINIIETNNTGPATTHDEIIKFFRSKTMRLVTTNFDLMLTESAKKQNIKHNSYYQPALPNGDSFKGIVYLHGAVSQDEETLVITEKDFARAYLKYGRQTAFIRELFSTFTVLFIGYSYDDKIFQFLTKSVDSQLKRYIFLARGPSRQDTQRKDTQKWDVLNLHVIEYDSKDKYDHKQLWDVISTWGDLTNLQTHEHEEKIKKIVAQEKKLTPQENDYIKCCLEDPTLAKYFFKYAKTERWMQWARDNNILDFFFRIDKKNSEVEDLTARWFSKNFITKNYDSALKFINNKRSYPLNKTLVFTIINNIARSNTLPESNILSQWIDIILSSENFPYSKDICSILPKCRIPQDNDIALLILNKITLPTGLKNRGDTYPQAKQIIKFWEEKFRPEISSIADDIETLITHHLKLHELQQKTWYNSIHYVSRPSIEDPIKDSPNDAHYNLIYAIIDIARDIINYFTKEQPQIATELIERWYRQKTIILKRLSIYGMTRHTALSASQKLSWILEKKELLCPTLRCENFRLIREIYPNLDETERKRLLTAAKSENKERKRLLTAAKSKKKEDYTLYNFAFWLKETDPECTLAQDKFNELQQKNPRFSPRKNLDLGPYIQSPVFQEMENISHISAEELIEMDMQEAIKLLITHEGEAGWDSEGLLKTLRDAGIQDFTWSFKLAKELASQKIWDKNDIWRYILESWNEIKTFPKREDSNAIIEFILKNDNLHVHHNQVAIFLTSNKIIDESDKNEQQSVKLAYKVRDSAFSDKELNDVDTSDVKRDWYTEAFNSSGYYICNFLCKVFEEKYKKTNRKREKLNEFFNPFIEDHSYSAQMGRMFLTRNLSPFFHFDKEWTRDKILPLFDWTKDKTNALHSWTAYLHNDTFDKELLKEYIEWTKIKPFDFKELKDELRKVYYRYVAWMTLYHYKVIFKSSNKQEKKWFNSFIDYCEEQDLAAFAQKICISLKNDEELQQDSSNIWKSFLCPYLDDRISGKPKKLYPSEFEWMLQWCLYLKSDFEDCVNKIIEANERNNILPVIDDSGCTDFFQTFKESEIWKSHPDTTGKLIHHLLSKKYISRKDEDNLREITETLKEAGCSPKIINDIIIAAKNLGFLKANQPNDK